MFVQSVRAPVSHPVDIDELRPTQITVGYREVQTRAQKLRGMAQEDGEKYLRKHVIPVVKGPRDRYYVIDHHHLCRALLEAGSKKVSVTVVLNLQRLDKDAFWVFLDNKGLLHPFDAEGIRREYKDIPKAIRDMADDPFRSLAGALRRKGGYAKDTTPFSEFLWADFLRRRFNREEVERDFGATLEAALKLAKKSEADHLPGWCGPVDEEG
ncbi:MAG TPA: ParB-like protein [Hyphomicrobiales bacterium]|nr:ParB-like protein [Hyphomicrobiales bacterium]